MLYEIWYDVIYYIDDDEDNEDVGGDDCTLCITDEVLLDSD